MMIERQQKIALAVWGNIMSPVFDSACTVLVVQIRNGEVISRHSEGLGPELPYSRAMKLSGWGVQVLICGAISIGFARTIEVYGIEIVPFISGEVQQVLDAYLNKTLISDAFCMPGFRGGRRNRFRGGRR